MIWSSVYSNLGHQWSILNKLHNRNFRLKSHTDKNIDQSISNTIPVIYNQNTFNTLNLSLLQQALAQPSVNKPIYLLKICQNPHWIASEL